MNALHQFVTSQDGIIQIEVPAKFISRRLEIIILPADDPSRAAHAEEGAIPKSSESLQEAHRIIDEGGGIKNPTEFLAEFERSRQDRPLPFRDWLSPCASSTAISSFIRPCLNSSIYDLW